MAVAFDAQTGSGDLGASPATFAHTPVGTPRGVTVTVNMLVAAGAVSSVTYGGVAMALIFNEETGGAESGRAYLWFLGSGIPTGAQNVVITHNGSGFALRASVVTVTAAADTELGDSGTLTGAQANPQVDLTTVAVSLRVGVIQSDHNGAGNMVMLSGMTNITTQSNGFRSARHDRQTTASSGSFTFGYTASSAAVALLVAAVQEATPAVPTAPSGLTAFATGTTTIDLSWTDNSGDETSFRVERSPNGSTGWVTVGTPAADEETFSNTGLTCNTEYFYRVFAVNGSGDSTASNTDSATTDACPPATGGGRRMGGSGAILKPPRTGR